MRFSTRSRNESFRCRQVGKVPTPCSSQPWIRSTQLLRLRMDFPRLTPLTFQDVPNPCRVRSSSVVRCGRGRCEKQGPAYSEPKSRSDASVLETGFGLQLTADRMQFHLTSATLSSSVPLHADKCRHPLTPVRISQLLACDLRVSAHDQTSSHGAEAHGCRGCLSSQSMAVRCPTGARVQRFTTVLSQSSDTR